MFKYISIIIIAILLCPLSTIHASEGGSSGYLQGSYGDFASGMIGPSGFYMRNDLFFADSSIDVRALGGGIDGGVDQQVWGDLLKFAYVSDFKLWGGQYNAAMAIPIVLNASVNGHGGGGGISAYRGGDVSGIGDIFITPAALAWSWENHHLNANLSFVLPTGGYDASRLLNTGRNYWSFDPTVNYTWLDPKRGHEFSFALGYTVNWENPDTDYTTGDELHLDVMLAQHFSASFAIGLTGYWYEQVTGDKGDLPFGFQASDFKGRGVGIGPAVLYASKIAGKDMTFILKWITDIESKNRMDGDIFMISTAFKF